MKLFAVGALVLAAAFILPPLMENAPSECGAVVSKVLSLDDGASKELNNPFARGMVNAFAAPFLEALMQNAYPNVPAYTSCAWVYWRVTFDSNAREQMRDLIKSK